MKIFTAALILSLICTSLYGQSFKIKDLSASEGNWKGKLTYLDYSSGKPYSMSANIKINFTENKKGYIMAYEYPAVLNNLYQKLNLSEMYKRSPATFYVMYSFILVIAFFKAGLIY
jgi:hypothetical protein